MKQYISIKEIADRILSHPMLQDVSFELIVRDTIDFMKLVGCPIIFEEKTECLDIIEYRAALPCDFYEIIQVRNEDRYCYRYATDSFHMSKCKDNSDLTYKIQGGVIYTSNKEGKIEIAYRAIPVDDEGYPALPDNSSFIKALELYIKKEHFTILFDEGRINGQVLSNTQQQYAWYVGQCQSDLIRPSIDQMESLTNSWITLVSRNHQHEQGFKTNGVKEHLHF